MGAIKTASKESGVDFTYLMNKAAQESGFKTDAKAKTSSATGLYQFTEQTWLKMVAEYGDKHGMGVVANQIDIRSDGMAVVKDRHVRQQILNLRKNPEMAASMAAELAQENKTNLQNNIGGEIGNTELYLAHFLGASGAANFIEAVRGNPGAQAAALLPDAAAANKSVFYTADGKPRTVAQIYDRFAAKMEGKGIDLPAGLVNSPAQAPAMLAQIGSTLNQLPDMQLPVSERLQTQVASLASPSSSLQALASSVTPESLFSVMVLSQMDKMAPASVAVANRNDRRQSSDTMMG
ncbi:MAG: transglycosylase SLT domain-containing protein [Alphaproteobacteria bacterium]